MCEAVPNLDLRFFVHLGAHPAPDRWRPGGNPRQIGYVIRERFRILGQSGADRRRPPQRHHPDRPPFGLFLLMMHIKYDYVEKLWTHELGIKMSVYALIAQLLGALVIRKIVNIKVYTKL